MDFEQCADEIDTLFRRSRKIGPIPDNGFYDEFSVMDTFNSNAIEGNSFTYEETKELIVNGLVTGDHSQREQDDIIGYKRAFDRMCILAKGGKSISEDMIKGFHASVLMNDGSAGEYRKIQNYIGDMFRVSFTPCAPEFLEKEMSDHIRILNHDMSAIRMSLESGSINWLNIFRTIARDHISFERIHPFIDGNGRTGRLLLSYELISSGLLPMDIRYEDSAHYYSAFREYERKIGYSAHPEDRMARLMIGSEIRSMRVWLSMFEHGTF